MTTDISNDKDNIYEGLLYRIFEKLNINSDVELTLLAVRNGLLDVDRPN